MCVCECVIVSICRLLYCCGGNKLTNIIIIMYVGVKCSSLKVTVGADPGYKEEGAESGCVMY